MKPTIAALERALINAALAQFRSHLKINDWTAAQWYARVKGQARGADTLALARAVTRLDAAISKGGAK